MPIRRAVLATLLALARSRRRRWRRRGDAPGKKITMIVGFAPGGGVDTLARVVAQELNDSAGFQVVIENRPGAGSNIAAKTVATAAPDGATLLFTGNSYAINQTIYRNPGYATADLARSRSRRSTARGLRSTPPIRRGRSPTSCAAAKDKPPSFGFGGSSSRIIAEYVLKVMAKTEATAVPFQSGAPALNALLGKHVDIIAAPLAELVPQVQQGALRVLAVSGTKRAASFPDVPMLARGGLSRPRNQRLDRHPGAGGNAGRHLREAQRGGERRRRQARGQCAAAAARLRAARDGARRHRAVPDEFDRDVAEDDPRHRHGDQLEPRLSRR